MNSLAAAYAEDEQLDLAEPLFQECLDGRRAALGDDHRDTRATAANLALLKRARGNTAAAALFYRETESGELANKSLCKVCVCALA